MGWLDAFTGAASKKAANATATGLREGNQVLEWGGDNARDMLLNRAIPAVREGFEQARALYEPMTTTGLTGVNAYQTAMGLGSGGSDAALAAFRNTPGYEFARSQGEDSVMRNAAARGMLAGGNTSADLARFGTGLADQTYGSYLTRLQPLMNLYTGGIQGQGNALTGGANAQANVYGSVADSYMNEATGRARGLGAIGQANAGGIMGAANAQGGLVNSGLGLVSKLLGYGMG
jgi:hypothetical protein